MKILLTNDDGVHAQGLCTLYEVLSVHHSVLVVAPDSEKSGSSNAFTANGSLTVKKLSKEVWAVSGYPSDCVILALQSSLVPDIDCVISGINHGPNIGDDIYFSGTVGAARTGCIFGKPSIAISMNKYHEVSRYFKDAADFMVSFLKFITEGDRPVINDMVQKEFFFNINHPDMPTTLTRGAHFVRCGKRKYINSFNHRKGANDVEKIDIMGRLEIIDETGTDVSELSMDIITISPINRNGTDFRVLEDRDKYSKIF